MARGHARGDTRVEDELERAPTPVPNTAVVPVLHIGLVSMLSTRVIDAGDTLAAVDAGPVVLFFQKISQKSPTPTCYNCYKMISIYAYMRLRLLYN